ncbi:MAG: carboxypeptidase [Firmicutes bacterium]|nr:carboxypeptidase [Bacillota bacterium]
MSKPKLRYDTYYQYDELTKALQDLAAAYPELCQLGSIGQSWEGREVWYVTLTNQATGPHSEKPAIYIDGNTHAGEVTGSMTALYTIDYLLRNYGHDPEVTWLLDTRTFYVVPRVNPDGAELYLTTPYMLRSSVRPWPYDDVSDMPGLYPEDIDGDGYILQMRVRDDLKGEWKVSSRDPRIMVPRLMDDRSGPFYRLYTEGLIHDYEGEPFTVRPTPWGLDLNRNFPSQWHPKIRGGGDYPASEPEVKNVVDFILAHKNIGALEALHTSGGIFFRSPYTYPESQMDQEDLQLLRTIARRGTDFTGYPDVPSTGGTYAATIVDWAYENCGIPGFTPELWDMAGRAGVKVDWQNRRPRTPAEIEEREFKLLQWNDRELAGEGFFRWRKFQHPQLGEVEIGGWNPKFVRQNPPPKLLEQECYKMCRFLLKHAAALPQVAIEEARVEKQADGMYKISVLAANHGFLPTYLCNKGREIKAMREDRLILELPAEIKLVYGREATEIGWLQGFWNGQRAHGRPAQSAKRIDFMVQGPADSQIGVKLVSEKGGVASTTISLT